MLQPVAWTVTLFFAFMDVKRLIWRHESHELVNDPRCNTEQFSLCVKQGEVWGLTRDDFAKAQFPLYPDIITLLQHSLYPALTLLPAM